MSRIHSLPVTQRLREKTIIQDGRELKRDQTMRGILAVGDCITAGVEECFNNSYPEKVAAHFNLPIKNSGYTMSTTREGMALLADNLNEEFDCIFIQFGLADAYFTFKYAPYIPYYPDNFLRKQLRNLVKKYKKTCRKTGLSKRLGEKQVVPEDEYRSNYLQMISRCGDKTIIMPETIPHLETHRNEAIKRYNSLLKSIADSIDNCHLISLYHDFLPHFHDFYLDQGHPNDNGYSYIAEKIVAYLKSRQLITGTASE